MIELLIGVLVLILVLWLVQLLLNATGLPPNLHMIVYVVIIILAILWLLGGVIGLRNFR